MNKQRYEALEQLFLNAGVALYKTITTSGMHFHYHPRNGERVKLQRNSIMDKWARGDRYDYRRRDGKLWSVEVDTLKDALLSQHPRQWVHRTIVVEEPKSVVHTTEVETTSVKDQVPEGATHVRKTQGLWGGPVYYKTHNKGWMYFHPVKQEWFFSSFDLPPLLPLYTDDPTKAKSDSKWVSAFERGESFARSGLDVMSNPYTTELARQEFFAGYAAYQRRTINHG